MLTTQISFERGAMRSFLGVEKSARGRVWRDRLDERGAQRAISLAQKHGIPELLARVVAGRHPDDDIAAYLDPTVKNLLPDPNVLRDMAEAASRIADAVVAGETIAIFGDYDVDGATSTALLVRFLRHAGIDPLIHIPDRIFEGYGPNIEAIRALAARGTQLLITVDCGTISEEPIAEAQRLGLDVIVIDHHQAAERLPQAIVVNPNRLDDLSGLGYLAAVGVVFVTLVAVNRELRQRGFWNASQPAPELLNFLDLVALGTIADVVPLRGLNRAFVVKGLLAMRNREGVGLTALMDVARLSGPPESWHLGFLLGPRINAGGRIGRADLGARLLNETDPIEAARMATELDRLNQERQAIEFAAQAEAEAEALAALGLEQKGAVVVTAARHWHPGILGLVAARLKEKFGRPAFAIALDAQGGGTGSARSIEGVDLGQAVRRAVQDGLLIKGGGHAMAAGITLAPGGLGAFRAFIEQHLHDSVEAARREDVLYIDAAMSAQGADLEMLASFSRAGPFGAGCPEPVFAFPDHTIAFAEVAGQEHVRARFRSRDGAFVSAIAFRAVGQPLGEALLKNRGARVHAAGTLSIDRWNGAERVQLRLSDLAIPDPVR